jgi:hypothetical protein
MPGRAFATLRPAGIAFKVENVDALQEAVENGGDFGIVVTKIFRTARTGWLPTARLARRERQPYSKIVFD